MQSKEFYNQLEKCLSESEFINAVYYINELKKLGESDKKDLQRLERICLDQLYYMIKDSMEQNDLDNAGKLITQYLLLSIDGRIQTLAEQFAECRIEEKKKRHKEKVKTVISVKKDRITSFIYIFCAIIVIVCVVYYMRQDDGSKTLIDEVSLMQIPDLTSLVNKWNDVHTNNDLTSLYSLYIHDDKVKFYGEELTRGECVAYFSKIYNKQQSFSQMIISEIVCEKISSDIYKCSFTKLVSTKGKVKDYPSYLVFKYINNGWYIIEESDEITDRNLKQMKH